MKEYPYTENRYKYLTCGISSTNLVKPNMIKGFKKKYTRHKVEAELTIPIP